MVYGQELRFPGDFFCEQRIQQPTGTLASDLQKYIEMMRPRTIWTNAYEPNFIHKDLKMCPDVFKWMYCILEGLLPIYEGPFPVIARMKKCFTLNTNASLSLDCLKPAYLIHSNWSNHEHSIYGDISFYEATNTISTIGNLIKELSV